MLHTIQEAVKLTGKSRRPIVLRNKGPTFFNPYTKYRPINGLPCNKFKL